MIDFVKNTYEKNWAYYVTRQCDTCFEDYTGLFILHININYFNAKGDDLLAYILRLSKQHRVMVICETSFFEKIPLEY